MTFWKSRRVTVTGGRGFLGSYVVDKLRERGCLEVHVPRRQEYDLVQVEHVRRLLRDSSPDMVIHLAARVGGIGANSAHPAEFFYENLSMGMHLLHEAWKFGVEKFIAVGTTCSYPEVTPAPFKEEHLWNGYPAEVTAPYGLAKKALLVQCISYRKQYGFNTVFLIPTNLYGPRDNFDPESSHVIPALIRKFVEAVRARSPQVVVWGSGRATRDFLYAEEAAEGIVLAAERYNEGDPVNLGSGAEVSIDQIVRLIGQLTGFQGEVVWDKTRPEGQLRRVLEVSKAEERFGFRAEGSLEENLHKTIAWYLGHRVE